MPAPLLLQFASAWMQFPCSPSPKLIIYPRIEDHNKPCDWLFTCVCFYLYFRIHHPKSAFILSNTTCFGIYPCFFTGPVYRAVGPGLPVFRIGIPEFHSDVLIGFMGMVDVGLFHRYPGCIYNPDHYYLQQCT